MAAKRNTASAQSPEFIATRDLLETGPQCPRHARPIPISSAAQCGVYFLILRRCVVYVGSSTHVLGRIGEHAKRKRIEFDNAQFIPCQEWQRFAAESIWISRLKPRCNGWTAGNGRRLYCAPREGEMNAHLLKLADRIDAESNA